MKIIKFLTFLTILVSFFSCLDELPETGSDDFCPGVREDNGQCPKLNTSKVVESWSFNEEADFNYESKFLNINDGSVFLKTIDTDFSGKSFENGTHTGTLFDNSKLKVKTNINLDDISVLNILPTKSASLIGYWRFENENWKDSSTGLNHAIPYVGGTENNFTKDSMVSNYSGYFKDTFLGISGGELDRIRR